MSERPAPGSWSHFAADKFGYNELEATEDRLTLSFFRDSDAGLLHQLHLERPSEMVV